MMKRTYLSMFLAALLLALAVPAFAEDVPTLRASVSFSTHQEAFTVAMAKGPEFKDLGVWLEPVVEREKFDLYENGKKVARLNLIISKGGSETSALFAQNHLDLALNSTPAMLAAIDRGTKIKILAPLQADGIAMATRTDIDVKGWDAFQDYVKKSKKPVTVGYHSLTSAPKIIFESAMSHNGLKTTGNANATKEEADILMVDIKSMSNVIPSFIAKQIEFAVVNTPTSEVIEAKKQGHIVLQMKELPPKGEWESFPCCCVAGSDAIVKAHPEAVAAYVKLITESSKWCMANKLEAAKVTSEWYGLDADIIAKADIEFSTKVTPTWLNNAERYPEMLNQLGQLTGALKGKKLADVYDLVFDFQFTEVEK